VVAFARVAFRNLLVAQTQVVVVRRFGVEGAVPEQGEGLNQADILEVGSLLDLDLAHSLLADHLGEVGHSRPGHILQEVDLDQAGNFLEKEHSLRVGGLLVGLGLIVNWEGAVGVVASGGVQDWEQGPGPDPDPELGEDRWKDLGLAGRLAHGH
jgi:hypothetical protein